MVDTNNKENYIIMNEAEARCYKDLDYFENYSYETQEISSQEIIYVVERIWIDMINRQIQSGNFEPSYSELAKWTEQYDNYFYPDKDEKEIMKEISSDEEYQCGLAQYVSDRSNGIVSSIEEFANNYKH